MSEPSAPTRPARAIRISAQTLNDLYFCRRRLWLNHFARDQIAPVSEHQRVLRELGIAHERAALTRFQGVVGPLWPSELTFREAAAETVRLLHETRAPLAQAPLLSPEGDRSGIPDLLYWDGDGLVVLEAKLKHRPQERPEFRLQLAHYAALLRESAGIEPVRFEFFNGLGELMVVTPATPAAYHAALTDTGTTLQDAQEPDLLLSHSKCENCGFYAHCWDRAEAEGRIEIMAEVHSRQVPLWHALDIRTVQQLAELDPARALPALLRPGAARTVRAATAWREHGPVWLGDPGLPAGVPLVWFDLEGDSAGEKAQTPIYLWGLAVEDGRREPVAEAIFADLDAGGDRRGWERFVARASELLERHPEARWVHYSDYEVTWLQRYFARYDTPAELQSRLKHALFDLRRVVDRAMRLPLRSYSIKHVAPWVGFEWRNPEAGSEWSVAQFYRARETADPVERARLLAAIAEYNADDLWAMRAVWRWIEEHAPKP